MDIRISLHRQSGPPEEFFIVGMDEGAEVVLYSDKEGKTPLVSVQVMSLDDEEKAEALKRMVAAASWPEVVRRKQNELN